MLKNFLADATDQQVWLTSENQSVSSLEIGGASEFGIGDSDESSSSSSSDCSCSTCSSERSIQEEDDDDEGKQLLKQQKRRYSRSERVKKKQLQQQQEKNDQQERDHDHHHHRSSSRHQHPHHHPPHQPELYPTRSAMRKASPSAPNLMMGGIRKSGSALGLGSGLVMRSPTREAGRGNAGFTSKTSAGKAGLSMLNDTRIGGDLLGSSSGNQSVGLESSENARRERLIDKISTKALAALKKKGQGNLANQIVDISYNVTTVRVKVSASSDGLASLGRNAIATTTTTNTRSSRKSRFQSAAKKAGSAEDLTYPTKVKLGADQISAPSLRRINTDPNNFTTPGTKDRWGNASKFEAPEDDRIIAPTMKSNSSAGSGLQRSSTGPASLSSGDIIADNRYDKREERRSRRRTRMAARLVKETLPSTKKSAVSSPNLTNNDNFRRTKTMPTSMSSDAGGGNGKSNNERWNTNPKNNRVMGTTSSNSHANRLPPSDLLSGMVIDTSSSHHHQPQAAGAKQLSPTTAAKLSSDLLSGMVIKTSISRSQVVTASSSSRRVAASNPNLTALMSQRVPDSRDGSGSSRNSSNNARWSFNSNCQQPAAATMPTRNDTRRDPASPLTGGLRSKLPQASAPNLSSLNRRMSRPPLDSAAAAAGISGNARWGASSLAAPAVRPGLGLEMLARTNSSNLLSKLPRTSSRNTLTTGMGMPSKYGMSVPNLTKFRGATNSSAPKESVGGNARWGTAGAGSSSPMRPNLSMNLLLAGRGTPGKPAVASTNNIGQPSLTSRWNSASLFDHPISETAAVIPTAPVTSSRAKMALDLMKATGRASQFQSKAPTNRAPPSRTMSSMGMGMSRKIGVSAPCLINFRRTATIPTDCRSSNANWGSVEQKPKLGINLLRSRKLQSEKLVEVGKSLGTTLQKPDIGSPRWDSGSTGDLSGASIDQRSTLKVLPKRKSSKKGRRRKRNSQHEKKADGALSRPKRTYTDESAEKYKESSELPPLSKIQGAAPNVSEGSQGKKKVDTPLSIIKRSNTDEPKEDREMAGTNSILHVEPVEKASFAGIAVKPTKVSDLVQEITEMLNMSASELQVDDQSISSPDSVSKAAVSLAALEMNRCARVALRKEKSEQSLGLEGVGDAEVDLPATALPSFLGCSETIQECPYKSGEESLDYISVDDTISHGPIDATISQTRDYQRSHTFSDNDDDDEFDDDGLSQLHDDGISMLHDDMSQLTHTIREEDDQGHDDVLLGTLGAPTGDSKLKVPSRRVSSDPQIADNINRFLNLKKAPAEAPTGLQKPQRRTSNDDGNSDLALPLPVQYGGRSTSRHVGQRKPQRQASIDTNSFDDAQSNSNGPAQKEKLSSHIAKLKSRSQPLLMTLMDSSSSTVDEVSVNAPFRIGRRASITMTDCSKVTASDIFSAKHGGASMLTDLSENASHSASTALKLEQLSMLIPNIANTLAPTARSSTGSRQSALGKASAMAMKDTSISSRSSKGSGNMFGGITSDMFSLLAADAVRKPAVAKEEKTAKGMNEEERVLTHSNTPADDSFLPFAREACVTPSTSVLENSETASSTSDEPSGTTATISRHFPVGTVPPAPLFSMHSGSASSAPDEASTTGNDPIAAAPLFSINPEIAAPAAPEEPSTTATATPLFHINPQNSLAAADEHCSIVTASVSENMESDHEGSATMEKSASSEILSDSHHTPSSLQKEEDPTRATSGNKIALAKDNAATCI